MSSGTHSLDVYGTILYPAITSRNRNRTHNPFSSFNNAFFGNHITLDMKVSDVPFLAWFIYFFTVCS